jgi:ATP-dependent 26S proteasome regulatory subunit
LAKNPQSRDDALEALDFIVNVLKEHEKDLDKLINELATVTEQLGDTGELSGKVEKVEEKINNLQREVTTLIGYMSRIPKETIVTPIKPQPTGVVTPTPTLTPNMVHPNASVLLRCNQWEDFQSLASKAQTITFSYKEEEKVFQADALRGNQIITYSGSIPKFSSILKGWLSRQLEVPEQNILEGVLTIR